ncbi:hypothetical protein HPB47_011167 [Ixodes persulcatus]|uniref:Uncharacterized protein n=1 Tax=Ixodes persulcatus TaxID=34615 RepID=A0AC60NX49_IXOPE|nr:hypothetical protein HPB47_011167 [Ixodes persulcatus]
MLRGAVGLFTTIEPERRRACCSHQKLGALDFELEDGHEGAASQRSCQPRPRTWLVKRHHRTGAGQPRAPRKLGPTPVTSKNKAWFRPKQDRRSRLSEVRMIQILDGKTPVKWKKKVLLTAQRSFHHHRAGAASCLLLASEARQHWILSSKTDTKGRPRNVPVNPGRVPGWSSDTIELVLGGPELLASLDPHP